MSLVGTSGTVAYCAPAEPNAIAKEKTEANAIVDALAPVAEQLTLGTVMVCVSLLSYENTFSLSQREACHKDVIYTTG